MELSTEELENAVEGLVSMLAADGFLMLLERDDDRIRVAVVAGVSACAECLVPKDLFHSMVLETLRTVEPSIAPDSVEVEYPRG